MIPILPELTAKPASPTAAIAPQLLAGVASFPALLSENELALRPMQVSDEATDTPSDHAPIPPELADPQAQSVPATGKSFPAIGTAFPCDLPHDGPAKLAAPAAVTVGQDRPDLPLSPTVGPAAERLRVDREGAPVSLARSAMLEQPSRDAPRIEPIRPEIPVEEPLKPIKADATTVPCALAKTALAPVSQAVQIAQPEPEILLQPSQVHAAPPTAMLAGLEPSAQRPLPAIVREALSARIADPEPQPLEQLIARSPAQLPAAGDAMATAPDLPDQPAPANRAHQAPPAPAQPAPPITTADAPSVQTLAQALPNSTPSTPLMPEARSEPRLAPQIDHAIERLVEARESGRAARPEVTVRHSEFGAINMRIEAVGTDLRATLNARDPAFVPAIQAALAERGIAPASEAPTNQSQRGHEQGPGQQTSNSGAPGHGQNSDARYGSSTGSGQASSQPYREQTGSDEEEAAAQGHSAPDLTGREDPRASGLFA